MKVFLALTFSQEQQEQSPCLLVISVYLEKQTAEKVISQILISATRKEKAE